jgi:uncharacterized protein GlcG (DUF336 family)
MNKKILSTLMILCSVSFVQSANAACSDVSRSDLLLYAQDAADATDLNGFGLPMWITMVDETGKVCHVVATNGVSGSDAGNDAWLGSRVISAQKANTANAFSTNGATIATGSIYPTVVPGGSLYGLQHSNPVDASRAYKGPAKDYGTSRDPLVGKRIGGVNVFGGGVALYKGGVKIGAIGASGDTSCRDHAVAYATRANLNLNQFSDVVGAVVNDILTLVDDPNELGEHPFCLGALSDPNDFEDFGIGVEAE